MKFSEAIFLGATMQPQIFGTMRSDHGTCALGAAEDALSINSMDELADFFSWAFDQNNDTGFFRFECPSCQGDGPAAALIAHLNDTHRWTRERIADWVASVEPQETEEQIVRLTTSDEHVGGGVPTEICSSGKS